MTEAGRPSPVILLLTVVVLVNAWIGVNAVWGLTSVTPTAASAVMSDLWPLEVWVAIALSVIGAIAAGGWRSRERGLFVASTMLATYVLGVLVSQLAQDWIDPQGPLLDRLFYLYGAVPMLVTCYALRRDRLHVLLRVGAWRIESPSWPLALKIAAAVGAAIVCLRLAAEVAGPPGDGWPRSVTIVALSLVNGVTEELLFRGLIFVALIPAVGLRLAIVLQALLFGFSHVGSSPAWIGELISAVVLVPLGALFAWAAYRRHGIGWVAGVHALLDIVGLSLLPPGT